MEPLSSGPDGLSVAEPEGGNRIAVLLVVAVVIGVIVWFGVNVVSALASCGGG